jgi:hypothetical protein
VQPDDLSFRSIDAAQLQHKLFPLHPVTLAEFKSNARVQQSCKSDINQRLMWRVMAEDLTDEQVRFSCVAFKIVSITVFFAPNISLQFF